MVWLRTWRLGIKSLTLHPLRSLLTVLGIFIGVASVIWLLAIGEGISRKAQEQIEGLGADNIIIRTIKPPSSITERSSSRAIIPYGITWEDYNRLVETLPTIRSALPIREVRREIRYKGRMVDGRMVGCTPEYKEVTRLTIDRGRFIDELDIRDRQNYCVLAANVAEKLFSYEDPLGRTVILEDTPYVVIGVTKPRMPTAGIGGSFAAQDFSNDAYVPMSTLQTRVGDIVVTRRSGSFEREQVALSQITLRVDKTAHVLETAELVKQTLAPHHPNNDFGVTVPLELLEQAKTMRLMFIVFMGLIAAISLLVGGIGIMNIMLATVTERTREIGIRRALGARRGDIVRQFLVETIALSTVGGLTGVLGGLTCRPVTNLIRWSVEKMLPDVMSRLPESFNMVKTAEPVIVPLSIPLAFFISVTIGVIFGLYPARRAAAMDPIEALRHE